MRGISWFCRIVEAGSFAAAARSVDVVPSALSKTVSALERELGFPLLSRSTHSLSLTREGALYYERCRVLLQVLGETEAKARRGRLSARGMLRVGLHPALRSLVLNSLGPFLDDQPELRVETIFTNSPSAIVQEGLDLLIHFGELPNSGLIAQRIALSRSVVCASPSYLALRGEPLHPQDLVRHRALIYQRHDEESNARWVFARGDERVEVEVPVQLASRDGLGLVDAILGGCGIGRASEFPIRPFVALNQLRLLLTDWEGRAKPVQVVWPTNAARMAAKSRLFLEFVASRLKGEGKVH
jgi:LysR family transcriptional regulator, regulator for bpeEF and oprC